MKCESCDERKATLTCVICGAFFCEKCAPDNECLFCDPYLIPIKKETRKSDKNKN